MHQHQTAILFFSRSARAECQYKILDKQLPYTHNLKLINQNISAAFTKIVDSGLPFFVFDENRQSSNSFGEKLSVAARECFGFGYKHLIIVGNDCPDLEASDMQLAAVQLQLGKSVLGKDKRGGFYLVGISKDLFDAQVFEQLPWSTPCLQDAMACWLTELGKEILFLDEKSDINTTSDYDNISDSYILRFYRNINSQFSFYFKRNIQPTDFELLFGFLNIFKLRGPPFFG